MSLGKRLKYEREKRNWSQKFVAEKIGITNTVLSNYERDYRDPDTETLRKLAELYDVSIDYLLDRPLNTQNNSLTEIEKVINDLGVESFFFKDIEAWKHLRPEDVEELKRHFEYVAHKAKERNKNDR